MKNNNLESPKFKSVQAKAVSSADAAFWFFCFLALVSLFLIGAPRVFAETQADPSSQVLISSSLAKTPEGMNRKQLRGTISAKNFQGIAVVYENDAAAKSSKEMWMPFGESTYLVEYTSLADIQEGDEVLVTYDEGGEGETQFLLQGISLVRRAPAEIEEFEQPDSEVTT